jgi:glycerol-3-phosphate dehydrogenase subunit B
VVVGAGVAGTAAALAARAVGADVTLVNGGTGASTLPTGAIAVCGWQRGEPPAPIDARAAAILSALDAFHIPDRGVVLATTAGIVRSARGADRALLDLETLDQGVVLVPRGDYPSWDGNALARAWTDAPRAQIRTLAFVAADATIARWVQERALPDADLAARHDDPARLAWLAERLREMIARAAPGSAVAVILPPWLGLDQPRADALSAMVGVRCGEAIGLPGGPSGLRFERARDRALARDGVAIARARVVAIARAGDRWRVDLDRGEARTADHVILATGGLVGGGLEYTPAAAVRAGALPPAPRTTFRATIAIDGADLPVGAGGAPLAIPGSLFGLAPESLAWPSADDPLLERVGVLAGEDGRVRGITSFGAAGELVADRERTWLDALVSGERAGVAAGLAAER